jgi:hypothetical protein
VSESIVPAGTHWRQSGFAGSGSQTETSGAPARWATAVSEMMNLLQDVDLLGSLG